MRRAISSLALATLAIVMVLGASAAYAFSTQGLSATTVTSTKTVLETSGGQASTVTVPTTVTYTSTSTSATTLISTQMLTTNQTFTASQTLTSTQTVTDTATTTITTDNSTTSGPLMFQFAVAYTVSNQTACETDGGSDCLWSGILSWPTSACDFAYSCERLQLGPQSISESYSIPLTTCNIIVSWSLSMTSPPDQSQLSVSVANGAGQVLYQESTSSDGAGLSGSYSPC